MRGLSSKMFTGALVKAAVLGCLTMQTAAQTLAVPSAPVMVDIPDAHEMPDPSQDYKIVFDMQTIGATSGDISPCQGRSKCMVRRVHFTGRTAGQVG